MQQIMYWMQPLVAAFTGWFTTWIAIYLLFHPREPKRILFFTIQGIFPKRQQQFATRLGGVVAGELLRFDDIVREIRNPEHLTELTPFIEQHIDHFLNERLKEKLPIIAMFAGEDTLRKVKEGLMEEIAVLLPELIGKFADRLHDKIDIEQMVTEKVSKFSSGKLEEILASVMSKEFRFVELIGGVLGFVIGLIQMALGAI